MALISLAVYRFARPNEFRREFGDAFADIVFEGKIVEASRIKVEFHDRPSGGDEVTIRRLGRPVVPDARWQERFLSALPRMKGKQKDCAPMPGVLLIFQKGRQSCEVRICYECGMIGVSRLGAEFFDGNWGDFDSIYAELVRLAKELFPDDPAIQKLKTKLY